MTHVKEFHNGKLLIGDVLDRIKDIPDSSIDCAISSPPYYNLRDYGIAGQIGLEADFKDYLKVMQKIMNEIRRILKPTGTAWINLGDSYSTQSGGMRDLAEGKTQQYGQIDYGSFDGAQNIIQPKTPFKPKTRIGIPERFYIDCIDNGWIARNHIVWAKSNAMPTSVKDRFQNKWESIFFFAKNPRYFFNLDAVREKPISDGYKPFNRRVRDSKKYKEMGLGDYSPTLAKASEKEIEQSDKNGWSENNHQPEGRSNFGTGSDIKKNMEKAAAKKEHNWMYDDIGTPDAYQTIKQRQAYKRRVEGADHDGALNHPKGKNPGDIFFINPKPFVEAHFATFPEELPIKIIKCAVPEKVCKQCGMPVEDIMEPTPEYAKLLGKSWHDHGNDLQQGMQQKMEKTSATASYMKVGEKKCDCGVEFEPGIVFDPFMGAGTVALTARKLNRRWIGIELNPEYAEIIEKRLKPQQNFSLDEFG